MKLKSISYICLYTSDLTEAVRFYRDVLGLEPISRNEDPHSSEFYAFNTGTTLFAIEPGGVKKPRMKTKAENPVLLQFRAESIEHLEEINRYLEEKGVKLYDRTRQMTFGLITNFCDPDGNKVEVLFQS